MPENIENAGEPADEFRLTDGSRIAIVGSGAAGALFGYFLLEIADRVGLDLDVTIFEPKDFSSLGPSGCNMCGGIIYETLVQALATEGINLPSSVVQRGIDAYVLHTDAGTVRIETPGEEKRVAAVHRGAGPLKAPPPGDRQSFDGFLLNLVLDKGVTLVSKAVTDIDWSDSRPLLTTEAGPAGQFDLVVMATGVNTKALKQLVPSHVEYTPPKITRAAIRELSLGPEKVSGILGNAMHLFLINIPRLKFAAVIPKGDCATLCVLGDRINSALLKTFLASPPVGACLQDESGPADACGCAPHIALSAAKNPYADRLVFIGDCGASRLYKDGIGAAYKMAKAAATTAIFKGVSKESFRRGYWRVCRSIINDNRFGRLIYAVTGLIQRSNLLQRAVLRMVHLEQADPDRRPRMSSVLWDTFSGSAPYKNIFLRTLDPRFCLGLMWNLLITLPHLFKGTDKAEPVNLRSEA